MMNLITKIGIGISFATALFACGDDDQFSDTPELTYRSFQVLVGSDGRDSLGIWSIGFTDGDGDFGVRNDEDPDNFIVDGFQIVNGQEERLNTLVNYRIPIIKNVVTKNGVEGKFEVKIGYDSYRIGGIDTLYLIGFAKDRAGNESNLVQTPIFTTN